MNVPGVWFAIILTGCAYRIWRLLAEDTILDWPRRKLVNLPVGWEEGQEVPADYRDKLAAFITCPWCFGFWISLALWGLWEWQPHWTMVFSFPMALSAAVGITRHKLDPPEE